LAISAPANALNTIGSTFEITLFNWNVCNPWNMDTANPNYEDAVRETVTITVVAPPVPNYQARDEDATGAVQTTFCLGQDIYFENLTTGGGAYDYTWEFFDDNTGSISLGTSTVENPTFVFNNPGQKLVRLTATDPGPDALCAFSYDDFVTLSPDAVAAIDLLESDLTTALPNPEFCQDGASTFTVGFRDATTNIEPNTEWRWEFLDATGTLIESIPAGVGTYSGTQQPDFTRDFSAEALTVVQLIARNGVTLCESIARDTIIVYDEPISFFQADDVCAGERTFFTAIADSIAAATIPVRVNDDRVIAYEWDFSYDGVTFNIEHDSTLNDHFSWFLDGSDIALESEASNSVAGTYNVALRLRTELGGCSNIFSTNVTVDPLPNVGVSLSAASSCPNEEITITNTSSNPSLSVDYELSIIHQPSTFSASNAFSAIDSVFSFTNTDDSTRTYEVFIDAETSDGCQATSDSAAISIFRDVNSGFNDPNYSFAASNCSPWSSTLEIDEDTRNLAADSYSWIILTDEGDTLNGFPVGKVSSDADFNELDYQIINDSASIELFRIVLEVTKTGLCIANDTFNAQIAPQPSGDFSISVKDDCEEQTLELEASQKGGEYDWQIDPAPAAQLDNDDFQSLLYQRPNFTANDQSIQISLVTTNLANCVSDTVTNTALVTKAEESITALFLVSADTIQLPDSTITFTNISSEGDLNYLWEFGNGDTSNIYDPGEYAYPESGRYQVRLTISNTFCEEIHERVVTVLPADPIIDFEADTLSGCSPLTVQFTNLSQFAESGSFLWEFGDGSISRVDNPMHTFFEGGIYSVRLRGQNEVGTIRETQKEDYINVSATPFADFLATPRVVFIPDQQVFFRALSENATIYQWDFGDGETSIEQNPRHSYQNEGFYDIELIVGNELGCTDTLFRQAEVQAIIGGTVNTPNAFTPNLNGPTGGELGLLGNSDPNRTNDVFLPRLEGVVEFKMYIYNKWGQLLFVSEDQNVGWDGYYRGRLAPAGAYVYRLELTYSDRREEVVVSDLTLLR